MSDYDPSDLLHLCDSILEDGELSGDEAYSLATWLNEHREACFHWPADLLVPVLQEIWADGKVTKTELRQLARVLVRVRKESVKRKSKQAAEDAIAAAKSAFYCADLNLASLPLLQTTAEIKSHSEKGVTYHVDLSLPSCTCPDFQTRRRTLPIAHLSRCCKHIFDAYRQLVSTEDCQGWLKPFIETGWPAHPGSQWSTLSVAGTQILMSSAPAGWSNVYTLQGNECGRYGYNLDEHRWAYGEAPDNADKIVRMILETAGHKTVSYRRKFS